MRRILVATPMFVAGILVFGILNGELFATPGQRLSGTPSEFSGSPERRLTEAVRIAKQGNVSTALQLAKQALASSPTDVRTQLAFIESLVEIQQVPGEEFDDQLFDNAIQVAGQLEKNDACNGNSDPALGFGHLRALGQLAYALESKRPKSCMELKYVIGQIAENLRNNPRVAVDSHKFLALPFFDKARGHAYRGEEQLVVESLQIAFQLGFSDFERARIADEFQKLGNAKEIATLIQNGSDLVTAQKASWARNEIARFSPFIYTFIIDGLNNEKLSHNDYRGKILIVDLWATWCAPCKKGIPHFQRLANEFRDQNVEVLGISVDNPDSPMTAHAVVSEFVKKQKLNYLFGLGGHSVLNQVPGETSLPTTLFINERGQVECVIKGYHPYADLEALTRELIKRREK